MHTALQRPAAGEPFGIEAQPPGGDEPGPPLTGWLRPHLQITLRVPPVFTVTVLDEEVANSRWFYMGRPPGGMFRLVDEAFLAVNLCHDTDHAYARDHGVKLLLVPDHCEVELESRSRQDPDAVSLFQADGVDPELDGPAQRRSSW
ncbi:hypothetical protein [Streptomyces sp. TLI_55]|uniref:hypothetical protein n=1 Tax=Streptomyces sp. TLI_55 TaxID=1938861 RepID=UPI0015CF7A8A|nr:hypothetical protein [Streptomyces sp. TLI_55]